MSTFSEDRSPRPAKRRGRPPGGGLTPAQARAALLDAAERSVLESGATATTMEAIARRSGYTRAVLYRHFANRDEVVGALALRAAERSVAEATARYVGPLDPQEVITESLVFVATEVARDPLLARLTGDGGFARLVTAHPEIAALLTESYEFGLANCSPERLRPGLTATEAAGYVLSIALALLMGAVPHADDPEAVRRYVRAFVLPALFTDPPPLPG
ncbi:HTH-type transcriptional regulator TtgR [Actinomadura rubteroloni]|uniref:HTH-type transcriptional regulator TtgR n=1 Tax=Actinomadura rubteroloni TaxID=1926885 RepID=A0A2P4UCT4_9ACTN|nr:TetR/AcrR family transcriptional regulator [Actinomadura rubteroloni]POM22858.1 HTH-type transcriptional regulator TtgR [Actinomadura rubteroloni]